jgi:hypothetical protein
MPALTNVEHLSEITVITYRWTLKMFNESKIGSGKMPDKKTPV